MSAGRIGCALGCGLPVVAFLLVWAYVGLGPVGGTLVLAAFAVIAWRQSRPQTEPPQSEPPQTGRHKRTEGT